MTQPHNGDILISAYLKDLELALSEKDPGEAASVLSSVREHIQTRLAEQRGNHDHENVHGILDELGPVERIARETTRNPSTARYFSPESAVGEGYARFENDRRMPFFDRPGSAPLAISTLAIILSPFILGGILGIAVLAWLVRNRSERKQSSRQYLRYSAILSIVVAFFALAPMLL